jgi:hypothetical protein
VLGIHFRNQPASRSQQIGRFVFRSENIALLVRVHAPSCGLAAWHVVAACSHASRRRDAAAVTSTASTATRWDPARNVNGSHRLETSRHQAWRSWGLGPTRARAVYYNRSYYTSLAASESNGWMMSALGQLMGCIPSRDTPATEDEGAQFTPLKHVRQSFSWDCGLACVMMVLQQKGMACALVGSAINGSVGA